MNLHKEYSKQYYQKHQKEMNEYHKKWVKVHRERIREIDRKYYAENCEKEKNDSKKYRMNHPNELRDKDHKRSLIYRNEIKRQVLTHYGNGISKCILCGFDNPDALTIDHIDGNGGQHRKEINNRNIYTWLKRNNYPTGFRTLCFNCQWIEYAKIRRQRY